MKYDIVMPSLSKDFDYFRNFQVQNINKVRKPKLGQSHQMFDELVMNVLPLSPIFGRNFVVTNDFSARPVKVDRPISKNVNHTLEKGPQL